MAKDCSRETAVLYRDNDCALPVIDLLQREGIAYRCRQLDSSFFTHRVVRDITDIIRFACDTTDGEIFMRIYYKLGAGISKAIAEQAAQQCLARRRPIIERLLRTPGLSSRTQKQCKAIQIHLAGMLHDRADKAIRRILSMGYGNYLREHWINENSAQILEALGMQEPTPERLIDRLCELREIIKTGSTADDCKFILSTIHSSKGLEYDNVVLMDVADGIFPKTEIVNSAEASPEELSAFEEERRLFYVGMTRAKNELSIIRFGSKELSSGFARSVFPAQAPSHAKPIPKASGTQGIPKEIVLLAKEYIPETRVFHKKFGAGEVMAKSDDIVFVRFDNESIKAFSLSFVLANNMLWLARTEDKLE